MFSFCVLFFLVNIIKATLALKNNPHNCKVKSRSKDENSQLESTIPIDFVSLFLFFLFSFDFLVILEIKIFFDSLLHIFYYMNET